MRPFNKASSEALKGLSLLLMLLHHNFRSESLFEKYTISFFPFQQYQIVNIASMAKICVSLFAFISGYGLYLSYKATQISTKKWILQRYIKTFSGYWIIWILSSIVCQIINGRFTKIFFRNNIWDALLNMLIDFLGLANLFGTHTLNGTWWYMSAAAVFILITPLLVKFEENISLFIIGTIAFIRVLSGEAGGEIFTGNNSIYAFLTPFMFGMLFAKNKYIEKIIRPKHKVLRFVVEFFLLWVSYKVYFSISTKYYWELKWGIIPLLIILFCLEFIISIPLLQKILIFIGKHSMNIFLVHTFIRHYYLVDFTYSWRHFLVIVLVLLLVSLCISFLVELIKKLIRYDFLINNLCEKICNTK